jgi:hypothetical protein
MPTNDPINQKIARNLDSFNYISQHPPISKPTCATLQLVPFWIFFFSSTESQPRLPKPTKSNPQNPPTVWQAVYAAKVYTTSASKVRERQYLTSFNFLMQNKAHPVTVFSERFRAATGLRRVYGFMLVQLLYTLATLAPVPWLYASFRLHTAFIFFVFVVASWNGSVFYTEVFANRYTEGLQARRKRRLTVEVRAGLEGEG